MYIMYSNIYTHLFGIAVGTYRSQNSPNGTCATCRKGDYQVNPGQTECIQCPQDYYCPVSVEVMAGIIWSVYW